MDEIHELYKKRVPAIMGQVKPRQKSAALAHLAQTVFGGRTFADLKTEAGIVATRWEPRYLSPGFRLHIADAVQASCSAYPFFKRHVIITGRGEQVQLIDGGYCANNPTLYAIADNVIALKRPHSDPRVVSVGAGVYPDPSHWHPRRWKTWLRNGC